MAKEPTSPHFSPGSDGGPVACVHCGLPVPRGLVEPGEQLQFCCGGCRAVYAALHQSGLEEFYRYQDRHVKHSARVSGSSYAQFDDETFQSRYCSPASDGSQCIDLYLEGVRCTACVWLVERLPQIQPGVVEARLDLGRSQARIRWDPEAVSLGEVARRLDRFGYPAHPLRGADRQQLRRREERRLLIRVAVAGAAAGNVMLIAFALYAGAFADMSTAHREFLRWVSLAVALPATVWAGSVFFRGAMGALRAGALHMDLPISIGIAVGLAWGTVNTLRGRGEVYFDSVTVLVFLLLIGRWLQQRHQRDAVDAAELLFSLTPPLVRLVVEDEVRELPVESLLADMTVEVRAGDTVPADGVVTQGRSSVDASLLSGESRPATVTTGDPVYAGTTNLGALLRIRVTEAGEHTRVGQLMHQVEQHASRRAPIVQLADRLASWFVATTLTLAALTALVWAFWDGEAALENAMALLIVSCPCALGLATPLAVAVAVGRAARRGILIKGADVVERLARPGRVVLDKTGTLTQGRLVPEAWAGDETVKSLVAALERHSAHHLARAIVQSWAVDEPTLPVARDVRETPGGGIEGTVAGRCLLVGSPSFVMDRIAEVPPWVEPTLEQMADAALSPVLVAADQQIVGIGGFGDPLRDDAYSVLAGLRRAGWDVGVLSGDHQRVVAVVAQQLGLAEESCAGGVTPEQKVARVQQQLAAGPVVMVGDGINDAAALSAATCGIAVHGGAEASLAAADAYIGRPGLGGVAELLDGARDTVRVIKRNMAFSVGYNLVGVTLAMAGVIGPLWAAVLMPLSSLTVVTSSFRTRAFKGPSRRRTTSGG